jgi:uncharacterized protein (DUF488 family)
MQAAEPQVFTIGHSNLTFDRFVRLLEDRNMPIATVVDVRSAPYSRFAPHFNRENFEAELRKQGITYRYAGKSLGGCPADPVCYFDHEVPTGKADYLSLVNYSVVAQQPWFRKGLERLIEIAAIEPTAIMCSEEDPAKCHRHHLIAKALVDRGVDVRHIRKDGAVEPATFNAPALQPTLF